eukprot:GHVS01082580.1.p1 GENE.GHVS01082580.1~~GHVS01082580.1.p1  ORF type:complete len:398 (+),score=140.13 GHVS01082580.1:328-1521(+)
MPTPTASSSSLSTTNIIDGRKIASAIRDEVKQEINRLFPNNATATTTTATTATTTTTTATTATATTAATTTTATTIDTTTSPPPVVVVPSSSSPPPSPCKRAPCLAVVLVGERRDSCTYVQMKQKACVECGISSRLVQLPITCTQQQVEEAVRTLNTDGTVDGIIVQLPLPQQLCEVTILSLVEESKDVDCLHPTNVGKLVLRGYKALFSPCTAEGVVELLKRSHVELPGAHVVVIGRSNIVGTPVALLLQQEDCTVTICHSKTKHIDLMIRQADIVVAAVGSPRFVQPTWLRDNVNGRGTVIVDVGINEDVITSDPTSTSSTPSTSSTSTISRSGRIVGDVDGRCGEKARLLTPVPGGVGPMTVAVLMRNAVKAWKEQMRREKEKEVVQETARGCR